MAWIRTLEDPTETIAELEIECEVDYLPEDTTDRGFRMEHWVVIGGPEVFKLGRLNHCDLGDGDSVSCPIEDHQQLN